MFFWGNMKNKTSNKKPASSEVVALALVKQMVRYEQSIDRKAEKTQAELRHLAFLRSLREAALNGNN